MNNDLILNSKREWRNREAQALRSVRRALDNQPLVNPSQGESAINFLISVGVCAVIFAFCLISGCKDAHAFEIDMDKIAMIESSGCKHIVGDGWRSLGCYQLTKGVVDEYNKAHGTDWEHREMLIQSIGYIVAEWYFNKRIPQMLKHFGKEDTVRNRLIAYNAGIKAVIDGRVPPVTKQYLKKYGV